VTHGIIDFTEFYRRHAPDVFRFAFYLARDTSEAEDITSETFVRVWTSVDPIEIATVKGYLLTIARNLFLQSLPRRKREEVLHDGLRDPRADPLARAESRSELAAVHERLLQMTDIDRSALLLRAVDGLSYEEIATTLGISLASAKVKVHRARLALAAFR
jgi:RNA polymerase sigma-70 factor, ECF subfamily